MARKKSVGGRAKVRTIENKILIQTQKINRRIRSLEKAGNYGKFKSAELIRFADKNPNIRIKRVAKGRHKLVINKIKMSMGDGRLVNKKLAETLRSKGFSNKGIESIKSKTKQTLSEQLGRTVSDEDVELFYNIAQNKNNDIIEKMNVSEFYDLVMEAKDQEHTLDKWTDLLSNYVVINNKTLRMQAELLYNKYVR